MNSKQIGDKKMKNQEIRNTVAELQELYAQADLYNTFIKQVASRRFSIA